MLEIYLIRHGETEWNLKKILQGSNNSPLTKLGIKQTEKLRASLQNINFDAFYSSPLGRASITAEILIKDRKQKLQLTPKLREMGFGHVEGLPKSEFKKAYPLEYNNLWNDPVNYNPCVFNGETFETLDKRIAEGLNELIQNHSEGGRILLVTHGMTLKNIFMHIWKHSLKDYWNDPVPENTSLSIIQFKDNKWTVKDFSNTDHLK